MEQKIPMLEIEIFKCRPWKTWQVFYKFNLDNVLTYKPELSHIFLSGYD